MYDGSIITETGGIASGSSRFGSSWRPPVKGVVPAEDSRSVLGSGSVPGAVQDSGSCAQSKHRDSSRTLVR